MVNISYFEGQYHAFLGWAHSEGRCRMLEHFVILLLALYLLNQLTQLGIKSRGNTGFKSNVTKMAVRFSRKFSYFNSKIEKELETEATKNTDEMLKDKAVVCEYSQLPKKGLSRDEILGILDKRISADVDPRAGKTFAYVYDHSDSHTKLTEECFVKYMHSNALNPVVFNSLRVI